MAMNPKELEKIKDIAKKNAKGKVVKAELPKKSRTSALDSKTRKAMEEAFGADFKKVVIHTGPEVTKACKELGAEAFTSGSHIYLKSSSASNKTLAHELAHALQQRSAVKGKVIRK